jgi:hypothetical protein
MPQYLKVFGASWGHRTAIFVPGPKKPLGPLWGLLGPSRFTPRNHQLTGPRGVNNGPSIALRNDRFCLYQRSNKVV